MGSGQVTNSIAEAPTNLLDMKSGAAPDAGATSAFNLLQAESLRDRNSFMGGMLAEADDTVAEGLYETDDAIAKTIGGDKAMPVTMADQSPKETADLVDRENGKEFLNIPNIYQTADTYSSNAKAAADRLFDQKAAL